MVYQLLEAAIILLEKPPQKTKTVVPKTTHLFPRTKGFVASVQSLRGHVDAVYDLTIGYVGGVPTLWQWIKGYVRKVHLDVRRYAIDTMPEDGEGLSDWLIKRFEEKDLRLDHFYVNGAFPATSDA